MAVIEYRLLDKVAVITIDDGKANVFSFDMLEALDAALDRALSESRAVVITGREGKLSGGFDLRIMKAGPTEMSRLVQAGAELLLRVYTFDLPVTVACTGHAVAAGALLLLAPDLRFGVEGPYKIGLNEVAIGMPMPVFGVELARNRLAQPWLSRAVGLAELFRPETALAAGFLDHLCEPTELLDTAVQAADRLAMLPNSSFTRTRQNLRMQVVEEIRETLERDILAVAHEMNPVESRS